MANLSLMGGDKPPKKKKVNACSNGKCGPEKTKAANVLNTMFTKRKHDIGGDTPVHKEEKVAGSWANQRNLGDESGELHLAVTGGKSFSPAEMARGRQAELKLSKAREIMEKNKKREKRQETVKNIFKLK